MCRSARGGPGTATRRPTLGEMHMRAWLERFWRDKRGMEEVEIGVVASLVVLIGALVFIQIGDDSQVTLGALEQVMDYVANQSGS